MWNFVWELNLCLGGLWGVYNITKEKDSWRTPPKAWSCHWQQGSHRLCGCSLWVLGWASTELSQLLICPDQTLSPNSSGSDHCQDSQRSPVKPSLRGSALPLTQRCILAGQRAFTGETRLGGEVQPPERHKHKAAVRTLPSPVVGGCEHIPCEWGDIWDICREEKLVKDIVLDVLDPSRENWLQPWLITGCLWGLEAFSLQFENPCCVRLFNNHNSIDFKVDNHHWALNTQSLLLELQLFFVNTNIKYLLWIRII